MISRTNSYTVLGFDFGMKHLGIATGQTISKTASPLTSLPMKNGLPNWQTITILITDWRPAALLVGLPLNMDGTSQPIAVAAKAFADTLASNYGLPVHMIDERLSTWEAKNRLGLRHINPKQQDLQKINALSAVILVEQWLKTVQ